MKAQNSKMIWCLAWLCLSAAAQEFAPKNPIDVQIERVGSLAAAEPPIFGLDTLVREAELLLESNPVRARRVIDDAAASLSGISDPPTYAYFLARVCGLMAAVDSDESLQLVKRMPPGLDPGPVYEAMIEARRSSEAALMDRALDAGSILLPAVAAKIEKLAKSQSPQAVTLYARVLENAKGSLTGEQAKFVAEISRFVRPLEPSIALRGFRLAAAAGWDPDPEIAAELDLTARPKPVKKDEGPSGQSREAEGPLSLAASAAVRDASFPDALEAVRKDPSPVRRISLLIDLSRRSDLTIQEQGRIAAESFELAATLPVGDENRLFAFTMLAVDARKRKDERLASRAAGLLAESFAQFCRCETVACNSLAGREDCSEMISAFEQYCEEKEIDAGELNIRNVSLDARLALRRLARMLGNASWKAVK